MLGWESGSSPLLSVVIPVFNVEGYLDRCIKSVKRQNYPNMEIILVDDGSIDSSGMMCDAYAERDDRIKVIHKENGGLVSARKAGLRETAGEYITYVDSDGWIEKDMYCEMLVIMRDLDVDIVTSGFIRDYGTYCVVQGERISPGLYEKGNLEEQFLNHMIEKEVFFQPNITFAVVNKIYKKELLMQCQA